MKKCVSFKEVNSQKTPISFVTEYCVKVTDDTDIIIRKNNKKPSGVELKLKHKIKGIDFDEWMRVCNAIEVVATVKDLLNGVVGKEAQLENESFPANEQSCVEDVDSLYNVLNSLNEDGMNMIADANISIN